MLKLALIAFVLATLSNPGFASVGDVIKQAGNSVIERQNQVIESKKGVGVEMQDAVITAKGKTAIQFVDDTRVDVTEHSKLIIDEFVYDPNTSTGKVALRASLGTVRYASGQIAKNSRQNIKISTPTAVIGVRGTDFAMTVDELGGTTVILLPSCTQVGKDLICVTGEISVESDVGTVILNQAFQATVIETPKSAPLKPLLLDIDESFINNLIIVRRPVEIDDELERQRAKKLADFLGIDFLEFEGLNKDYLAVDEDDLWQTELDFELLSNNFLYDVLDQLNEMLTKLMRGAFEGRQGIQTGLDPETGIELLDAKPNWIIRRDDGAGNFFELRLNQQYGYSINMQQNDFEYRDYQLGDGQNTIDINQSN